MAKTKGACVTVAKGGVGESGASAFLHHKVTSHHSKMMVLRCTDKSLCPNTGAVAMLIVNGVPEASGDITTVGSSIQHEVPAGANVCAVIHTIPLFNEVMCVRLGELNVHLDECELVG